MIDRVFLERIGMTPEQIGLLKDALDRVSRYRQILLQEGVDPKYAEMIINKTELEEVDFSNDALLREKVRYEWHGFIKYQK